MLLFVVLSLLIWIALSFTVAPIMGVALRRCEVQEQLNAVEVLRAKAQHPARRAA